MRLRIYLLMALIITLGTVAMAEKDKDKVKSITCGNIRPLESRADVEARVGRPVLSDPINHIFHYPNSTIIIVDAYDRVINVHGPHIELDGEEADFTTRDDLEKKLKKGTETIDKEGKVPEQDDKDKKPDKDKEEKEKHKSQFSHIYYSKWGMTVYMHGDDITGYLLEPTR
jgi:hypothetical protein